MTNLRILSLVPAATEIIFLLDLEKYLVGVSHECDYPEEAKLLPKVTSSPVSNEYSSRKINEMVAQMKHRGNGVFHIDEKLLARLKPNLILTQELCDVCAISWTEVKKAAKVLDGDAKIISLEPGSIGDIFENIFLIGETSRKSLESRELVRSLEKRIRKVDSRLLSPATFKRPKVLVVEWLDPIMIAGHWVPEMVEKVGGVAMKTKVGEKSYPITIEEAAAARPDVVIFAPCGFDIERTLEERELINNIVKAVQLSSDSCEFYLMDGNSYLTRPGPRIIDGVEILGEILHPEKLPKKHEESDWLDLRLAKSYSKK